MNTKNRTIAGGFLHVTSWAVAILMMFSTMHFHAHAAEWRVEPIVRVAGEIDDNADLTFLTVDERELTGYLAELRAKFAYTSPLTEFTATPRFLSRNYGDPDFDSNDHFLRFDYRRQFRSSTLRIRGNYGRELARTGERADAADLDVEDPDEVPTDDSGRVFIRGYRQRLNIAPQYTYRISSVSSLGVSIAHTETQYEDDLAPILSDYSDTRSNLTYSRDWSRRNTAIFTGTFRTYDSECSSCDDSIVGYGIRAGVENRISETTTLRAIVGAENTELETGTSKVSPVANIGIYRQLETIRLLAQYQRVISGGGGGTLLARDIVNLNFRRELSDRISGGLGVRAYETTALEEGQITIDERDYIQLRALFMWNMTQNFSMELDYRYTVLDREVIGESANSNNIMLWFSWRPTPIVTSR
jgi:hypothetical protein